MGRSSLMKKCHAQVHNVIFKEVSVINETTITAWMDKLNNDMRVLVMSEVELFMTTSAFNVI